jgi:hypothetical protein
MVKGVLLALLILIVIVGAYAVWARGFNERAEAAAIPLFVPVIVTPSIQLTNGQMILYKATNLSENPDSFRLMLYNDREGVPGFYKDFNRIRAGNTVSYVYEPPESKVTLGTTTVEAPEAVRAVFAPVPGDDPGAVRRIVANVQIMRVQKTANGPASLDPPIVVPVEHCNFEPRGFVPYTGGRWYWNCAPEMFPIAESWRQAGQR